MTKTPLPPPPDVIDSIVQEKLQTACDQAQADMQSASQALKDAVNESVDASADLARAARKISTPALKAVPVTPVPGVAPRPRVAFVKPSGDVTGRFARLKVDGDKEK